MLITAAVAREKFGAFSIEQVELTEPRADELLVKIVASGMCQTDQHGRDGYYNTPLPAVFGHEGAGVVEAVGKGVTRFRARRPCRDVVSLVRRLPELPPRDGSALPEELRPQDERHPRRRLDADEPERRAGLQRLLPAIVVCDPCHRERTLCGEDTQRRAARSGRPVRLQRTDRRRRGAQFDAAELPAIPSRCSASARSGCRA